MPLTETKPPLGRADSGPDPGPFSSPFILNKQRLTALFTHLTASPEMGTQHAAYQKPGL